MRAVLDPNVIVSVLLSSATTAAVLDAWLEHREYELVVCPTLLGELEAVLARPKFSSISKETVRESLERLRTEADLRDDPVVVAAVTPDPGDDYLVALARESQADCLVSGDPDLRELDIAEVEVFTPAAFLSRLQKKL
jgi:putative PIN family toxin of toxin-antitoxin system